MQIEHLKIRGLYGYIDKDIDFNNDITLLVGINGSGKTSILNVLNWVIKPSIPHLCVTEFVSIELRLKLKNTHYKIDCRHTKTYFKYNIYTDSKKFNPLTVRTRVHPKLIKNDEASKNILIQEYSALRPDTKEAETWELISKFPKPTIVGLDRNLYTEESERVFIDDSIFKNRINKKQALQEAAPLDRVKEIVNREYRRIKNNVLNLTTNLKNHLMLSTFDGSITQETITSGIGHKLNTNQIEGAETRVNDYFSKFENKIFTDIEKQIITKYFSQLKEITNKYQDNPSDELTKLLYALNANQFVKVNRLLKEFEKFETASAKSQEQINIYIDTLNHFFKDSSKQLIFKEDTSELAFNNLDKNGKPITEFKDIRYLSSGEQQILILFSYIAFNSYDGKIFIIDEPELSLHIKWQEDFLYYLEKITPTSTQLILATHSPILAGKKKEKAKVLLPYNI